MAHTLGCVWLVPGRQCVARYAKVLLRLGKYFSLGRVAFENSGARGILGGTPYPCVAFGAELRVYNISINLSYAISVHPINFI